MTAHRPDIVSVFLIHSRTKFSPMKLNVEAFPAIMGKCNHHSCWRLDVQVPPHRQSENEVMMMKGEIRETGIQELKLELLDPTIPEASQI